MPCRIGLGILTWICLVPNVRAESGPSAQAFWAEVVEHVAREQRAMKTLQLAGVFDDTFPTALPAAERLTGVKAVHREACFLKSGDKFRVKSVRRFERGYRDIGGPVEITTLVAYDAT